MNILRCPFCNCDHTAVIEDDTHVGDAAVVMCSDCGARGPSAINDTDAIAHWNHRGSPHPAV
jgi:Lar family restriction alleviation protein